MIIDFLFWPGFPDDGVLLGVIFFCLFAFLLTTWRRRCSVEICIAFFLCWIRSFSRVRLAQGSCCITAVGEEGRQWVLAVLAFSQVEPLRFPGSFG